MLRVMQHRLDLFARHAGKPGKELVNARPSLQVLKKCADGYTRTAEYPSAADFPGVTFHG